MNSTFGYIRSGQGPDLRQAALTVVNGYNKIKKGKTLISLFRQQPRAFYLVFFLEFWERAGFYTVQGILILYLIRILGLSDTKAYDIFGAFSALIYSMVVCGGYLGDKVLGTKRTILLGLIVLCLGYFFLAVAEKSQILLALGLICVGNGLFKANPANLLSRCYEQNDPRLHGGFTLYYMAVNIGSILALFAGPMLSSRYGYFYAYMLSALGLFLAILNYWYQYPSIAKIETEADGYHIGIFKWFLVALGIVFSTKLAAYFMAHIILAKVLLCGIVFVVLMFYAIAMKKEEKAVVLQMLLALILMGEAIIFFILYQQMPTSLNLFAVQHVLPRLLGFPIDPQSFQALNPLWIVLLSTPIAFVYGKLNERGISFSIVQKFALGMTCSGLSFLLLYFSRYFYNQEFFVSSGWLIASYLLQSLGELLVSALGMAMVAELAPSSIRGFVMGMWFLCSAVAGFLGATVASYTALPAHLQFGMESLKRYTLVFGWIGVVILAISALMWISAPVFQRWIKTREPIAIL